MGDIFQYCIMNIVIKRYGLGDDITHIVLHFLASKDMSHMPSECWSAFRSSCSLTQSASPKLPNLSIDTLVMLQKL